MIDIRFSFEDTTTRVVDDAQRASERNIRKAAFQVFSIAQQSINPAPKGEASPPGTPPNTRIRIARSGKNKGKRLSGQLERAIVYNFDRMSGSAVIGPRASFVGQSAAAHEFGGTFKGQDYPERPFMGPALDKTIPVFGNSFSSSIGG